jgi:hypothetical protein
MITKLFILLCICSVATFAETPTGTADADSVIEYREVKTGMAVSGGCMFGISWGLALVVTPLLATSSSDMDQRVADVLWIPIAGPIVADVVDGMDDPAATFVCVTWSVCETIGAILLTRGIIGDKKKGRVVVAPKLLLGKGCGMEMQVTLQGR